MFHGGESQHPEWDQMYAAGISMPEIAALCHAKGNTVRLHFQVLERRQPGTRALHDAAAASRKHYDGPSAHWVNRLADVLSFKSTHGRLPESADEGEAKRLYSWVLTQRQTLRAGKLKLGSEEALELLGDWKTPLGTIARQAVLDNHWRDRLAELAQFVAQTGREPRYKRFKTKQEHSLGVWLHVQTQARTNQKMPEWRLTALDEAVPGWHSHE